MPRESENSAAIGETPAEAPEPPRIFIRACGALCDALWWARPSQPAARAIASAATVHTARVARATPPRARE